MKDASLVYTRLPLTGARNCRELGGYPSAHASQMRWKRVVRSGDITLLTAEDKAFLKAYGLKRVIDLRSPVECAEKPNPFLQDEEVSYINVNLIGVANATTVGLPSEVRDTRDLTGIYKGVLDRHAEIREVLLTVLGEPGCVLFHCAAGKDRTGVIAMLLMALAGAERKDLITNYQISFTNLEFHKEQQYGQYPKHMLESLPEYIDTSIDYLLEKHGSFENYFHNIGLTEEEIDRLRASLIV